MYNDGVFSDEDFDSIQSIGDSKKRGQLAKTGTSVPCLVPAGCVKILFARRGCP